MKSKATIFIWLAVMSLLVWLAAPAQAATLSLVPSKTSLARGESFSVEIKIDDPTGVGACAFTLAYPDAILSAPTPDSQGAVTNITSVFFQNFQSTRVHRENTAFAGEILFSGATINPSTGGAPFTTPNMVLFTIPFTVKADADEGSFNLALEQTELLNPNAGWGSGTTFEKIPVLVGAVPNTHQNWSDLTKAFPVLLGDQTHPYARVVVALEVTCPDNDQDGLCNEDETKYGTNPNKPDTDGDGLKDGQEVHIYKTDPLKKDTDGDGMEDGWEVTHGLNPIQGDANSNPDGDGCTNLQEYQQGRDPQVKDCPDFTITATAGAGGTIEPSGAVPVPYGWDQTFKITPNRGYKVQDVKVDGKSQGKARSYTFKNVQSNHTIQVVFEPGSTGMPWLELLLE